MSDKTTEYLKYEFDEQEKANLAQEMARAVAAKAEAEDDLAQIKKQIQSRIADAEKIVQSCADKLRTSYEYRQVQCTIRKDFDANRVVVVRDDTGEIVNERPLREGERQVEMRTPAGESTVLASHEGGKHRGH